jgi:hypothetical protein
VTDFGASAGFRLQLFTSDTGAYADEILPLAAEHPALAAVPATRFADDAAELPAGSRRSRPRAWPGLSVGWTT